MRTRLKRADGALLKGKGLIEINNAFQLPQRRDQRFGSNREGKPESSQAPTLRQGKEFDSPLTPAWAVQQGWSLTLECQIHIGIVVGNHRVMTTTQGHDLIQQSLVADASGGVMGVAEDEQLDALPGTEGETIKLRQP